MKRIHQILVALCLLAISSKTIQGQNYTLPEYTTFQLNNGLTVYLMEQHHVPLISVSAILPAGAIYDGQQSGLAVLTAASLRHGTQNYSKAEIDETLDFVGARLNVSASKEFVRLSSRFAEKDQDQVMTIVKELLCQPLFNSEEFDKEKNRFLTELERDKESPRSVIGSYFDKQLFGDHVYANSLNGTKETVENISIEDIKEFYKETYIPNNAAITVVGDFDSKTMKKKVKAMFSDWKKGRSTLKNLASRPLQKPTSGKVLLVNKDDANETTFYIGGTGVSRNNKDYVAIQVINTLFGGRFTSMLNAELRTNSGLTYGARSRFANYKYGGSFYISTFTANETTEEAIDLALEVLGKLHGNALDEKSLTSAKNYVKGQFPPRYETIDQLSNLLTEMFWYDFDETFINDFEKNVNELTLAKAKKIITTYFPRDDHQFVLIGKASEIRNTAKKYGPVEEINIKD